ncbi:MAG TPA: hypothetical protein DEA82_13340 [Flavobacteriaceae bacterium]|nr:hypothetical protein [Flavobacteriaceae bacterium]HBR55104.1 hypothetical protein [Flavobacteriaceae bacterium]
METYIPRTFQKRIVIFYRFKYGSVLRNFLKEVFEKAIKNGADASGSSIATEVHHALEKVEKQPITADAIRGYYRKYKNHIPFNVAKNSKDQLARYIGYESYRDFVQKNTRNGNKVSSYLLWFLIVALGVSLSWNFFVTDETCCMIWMEDHWEETACSGKRLERACDTKTLRKMKRVEVCKDAAVKKNYQPVLWYDKSDDVVTFFTYHGLHPVNGKTLKQATRYMVEKYGEECD